MIDRLSLGSSSLVVEVGSNDGYLLQDFVGPRCPSIGRGPGRQRRGHGSRARDPDPDAHQDHRLVSELTRQTFRDHLILEYEVPKYDGDLGQPRMSLS
jgi:hypothetical protein